uniref:Uncharacterized protein n=1 Tax=Glossina brevipalpis TaxID=37001 RepID=A0A1A9X168_9MUSC
MLIDTDHDHELVHWTRVNLAAMLANINQLMSMIITMLIMILITRNLLRFISELYGGDKHTLNDVMLIIEFKESQANLIWSLCYILYLTSSNEPKSKTCPPTELLCNRLLNSGKFATQNLPKNYFPHDGILRDNLHCDVKFEDSTWGGAILV